MRHQKQKLTNQQKIETFGIFAASFILLVALVAGEFAH